MYKAGENEKDLRRACKNQLLADEVHSKYPLFPFPTNHPDNLVLRQMR